MVHSSVLPPICCPPPVRTNKSHDEQINAQLPVRVHKEVNLAALIEEYSSNKIGFPSRFVGEEAHLPTHFFCERTPYLSLACFDRPQVACVCLNLADFIFRFNAPHHCMAKQTAGVHPDGSLTFSQLCRILMTYCVFSKEEILLCE